jgi:hypothetical protein
VGHAARARASFAYGTIAARRSTRAAGSRRSRGSPACWRCTSSWRRWCSSQR